MFANVYFSAELEEPVNELEVWVGWPERLGTRTKLGQDHVARSAARPSRVFGGSAAADLCRREVAVGPSIRVHGARGGAHFPRLRPRHVSVGADRGGWSLLSLVKVVTAFTVAHSITLCLAALEIVRLPSQWIEAGIALSIVYVAVENFWLKRMEYRWIITFAFGLVHGFGFANVLRELGLPTRGLVASLFAFNAGVEIGQVAIVALIFPLIAWLSQQSYQRTVVLVVSAFIGLFGLGWFVERVLGLEYMPL